MNNKYAEVPELAACVPDGTALAEALPNIQVGIDEVRIETAKAQGRNILEAKGKLIFA